MSETDRPMQLGPNHHRMEAPNDVTMWTIIRTTREVVTDDGRGMTLRDEWWDVPTFVIDAAVAAGVTLAPTPPDALREAARAAVEPHLMRIVNRTKPMDQAEGLAILADLDAALAAMDTTPERGNRHE